MLVAGTDQMNDCLESVLNACGKSRTGATNYVTQCHVTHDGGKLSHNIILKSHM